MQEQETNATEESTADKKRGFRSSVGRYAVLLGVSVVIAAGIANEIVSWQEEKRLAELSFAITQFPVVPVKDAGKRIGDEELVLGVAINGEARAYPLNMLSLVEILNDTLGGREIAATY